MTRVYQVLSLGLLTVLLAACGAQRPLPAVQAVEETTPAASPPALTFTPAAGSPVGAPPPSATAAETPAVTPLPPAAEAPAAGPTTGAAPAVGTAEMVQAAQPYFNPSGNFSLLLPPGWEVGQPQQTPLGEMTLLGPAPLAEGGPRNSTIVVAGAGVTPEQAAEDLCGGTCPGVELFDAPLNGLEAKLAIIGTGSPGLTWYFVQPADKLIYFSLHDPDTLEPLYGISETFTPGPEPQGPATVPAARAARQLLADQLGISPYAIVIRSAEPADWPDACLGWPGEGEMCAGVITPGYGGILEGQASQLFEYRVNQAGTIIRLTPGAAQVAALGLSQQLGLPLDQVRIVSAEPVEWANGCLELPAADEMCTEAIMPGYRVVLEANGQRYEYHTDETGSQLRLASAPEPRLGEVIITWTQQQGWGCELAQIGSEGVAAGGCGNSLIGGQLLENRGAELAAFRQTYASFEAETPAGRVTFAGQGKTTASPAEQRMIAEWARLVYQEARAGRSGAAWGLALAWNGAGESAGFCNNLSIHVTGIVMAATSLCEGGQVTDLGRRQLTSAQLAHLYIWLDQLANFEITETDPARTPPTTYLVFNGTGPTEASPAEKQAIQAFAAELFAGF